MPDFPNLERKIRELERRVQHLEERVEFLREIADPERDPFIYLVLETGLTRGQVDKIYDLMDEVREGINTGKPMHHSEFERRVYEIVPSRKGDYHFAEQIVSTLNETGKYQEVYQHMKKSGMNI